MKIEWKKAGGNFWDHRNALYLDWGLRYIGVYNCQYSSHYTQTSFISLYVNYASIKTNFKGETKN